MIVLLRFFLVFGLAVVVAGLLISRPETLPSDWGASLTPDVQAGAAVFSAAGCASCHVSPDAETAPSLVLSGGKAFKSDFGTFYAPNISPDEEHGIGTWTRAQFATALLNGVSPEGSHYYPVFPFTAYTLMESQDIVDLHAYLQTLPESDMTNRSHDVAFPFSMRRGVGLWKSLYLPSGYTLQGDLSDTALRGRYLAEALGHCAECHTPRSMLGGLDRRNWMAGAKNPAGTGKIPGITRRQLSWTEADLMEYFTSGFTPEYDSVSGNMVDVVEALSRLPVSDRAALAAYVKALP